MPTLFTSDSPNPRLENIIGSYLNTACRESMRVDKRDAEHVSHQYRPAIEAMTRTLSTFMRCENLQGVDERMEAAQNGLFYALFPNYEPDETACMQCVRNVVESTFEYAKEQCHIGQHILRVPSWPHIPGPMFEKSDDPIEKYKPLRPTLMHSWADRLLSPEGSAQMTMPM